MISHDGEPVLELRELYLDEQPKEAFVSVEVLEDRFTADTFPIMEITVENTGDEPFKLGWHDPPFKPPWVGEDIFPNHLAIYPTEFITEHLIAESGCARIEKFKSYGDLQFDTIEPGESMTNEYGIVFVEGKLRDWPDPGEYRAPAGLRVGELWGFDFELVQVEGNPLPRAPTAEGGLVLDDVRLDEQPMPLRMSVEVIEIRLSEDSAPVVEVTMENTGDEPLEIGKHPPWPQRETDPNHFTFVPTRSVHQALLAEPGCPRVRYFGEAAVMSMHTIDPGEISTEEYAIVGIDGRYEGDCPEPGIYRSEARLGLEDEWGFDLEFVEA